LSTLLSSSDVNKLIAWNQTTCDYPDVTLKQLLEEQLAKTPNEIAITFGECSLTYKELHGKANQWANFLKEQGVESNTLIAVYLPRSLEAIIVLLSIIKAGGAYLPIDVKQPVRRIKAILDDSQPLLCITSERLFHELTVVTPSCRLLSTDWVKQYIETLSTKATTADILPSNLSYVIYTSGSTGTPKGVANKHSGTVNRLLWMQDQFALTQNDRILQKTSLSFDVAVWEIWWPLLNGSRLILASRGSEYDPNLLCADIVQNEITIIHFVPSQLEAILVTKKLSLCSTLRVVIASGEVLTQKHAELFSEQTNAVLYNLYGPTEASIDVSFYDCRIQPCLPILSVPIGRPIANTQLFVLDQRRKLVSNGETGELYITGKNLADGYWRNPALTKEKFFEINPFQDTKIRAYKTGDLVRWLPDGNLEFIGRSDNQLKIRGFRIEPAEIESIVLKYPEIQQARIISKKLPNEETVLVGYLVMSKKSAEVSSEDLEEFLIQYLPDYMVPQHWFWLECLPLTIAGKLDLKALPDSFCNSQSNEITLPTTDIEQKLVKIWQDVLRIEAIGINDNFYYLGGTSLSAIVIMAEAEKLGIFFKVQQLMKYPTVAELFSHLELNENNAGQLKDASCVNAKKRAIFSGKIYQNRIARLLQIEENLDVEFISEIFPTTAMQQGMLFHTLQHPNIGMYIDQIGISLKGKLDEHAVHKAWQSVLNTHDCLRTGFYLTEFEIPQQVVYKYCPLKYSFVDVRKKSIKQKEQVIDNYLSLIKHRGFDFKSLPLWEVCLFRFSENEYTMIYSDHHAISDGFSQGLFFKDFFRFYAAEIANKVAPLSPNYPFSEYIEWYHNSQTKNESEKYWKKVLDSIENQTILGIDKHNPTSVSLRETHQSYIMKFPDELVKNIKEFSRKEKVTFNTIIQAAWILLLSRYSREDTIIYGLVEAGRHISLANITQRAGAFLQTFPMVVKLSEFHTISQLLNLIQSQVIESSENSCYPLNSMQKLSNFSSHIPIFRYVISFPDCSVEQLLSKPLSVGEVQAQCSFHNYKTHYPLSAMIMPIDDSLTMNLMYDISHFDKKSILQFCNHWVRLLESIIYYPTRNPSSLPMLSLQEEQQLYAWNNHYDNYPQNKTVLQLFEERVEKTPNNIAVIFNNQEFSYFDLNKRANQIGRYLKNRGVEIESNVILHLERGYDLVTCIIAILKAGGVYVPIDLQTPLERIKLIVSDSKPKIIITNFAIFEHDTFNTLCLNVNDLLSLATKEDSHNLNINFLPENLMYLLYTSGSTGAPKGVMVEHSGIVNLICSGNKQLGINEKDRIIGFASPGFDASVWEMWMAILSGATLCLALPHELLPGTSLNSIIEKYGVTFALFPPSVANFFSNNKVGNLKTIVVGGETASLSLFKKLMKNYRVLNAYGCTETSVCNTLYEGDYEELLPIGKPLPNIQAYVLDRFNQLVPQGCVGELCIGGAATSRGYLNLDKLNEEKFIQNRFRSSNNKLYKTGDLVRWLEDGNLEYIGRMDEQVKIRGFRIELGEVENALLRNSLIADVKVVLSKQTPSTTDGQMVAYMVASNDWKKHVESIFPEHVFIKEWQHLYEETYKESKKTDADLNIVGWKSSYNGDLLSEDQMYEWCEETIKRINFLYPDHVLEIGCGTGMLLKNLAPLCESYQGTDFSLAGLDSIKFQYKNEEWYKKVILKKCFAHDFSNYQVQNHQFDLIILNSVIQYFPSQEYLSRVITKNIMFLKPGGHIFIGDVRNYNQLKLFHLDVELEKSKQDLTFDELSTKVDANIFNEKELVVSPEYFYLLSKVDSRVCAVEIQIKRGHHHTEMNKFRYDTVLHFNKQIPTMDAFCWIDWDNQFSDLDDLSCYLEETKPSLFAISSIPNARIFGLEDFYVKTKSASELQVEMPDYINQKRISAIDPELLAQSAEDLGYEVFLTPDIISDKFRAILYDPTTVNAVMIAKNLTNEITEKLATDSTQYANHPQQNNALLQMIPSIREELKKILPRYMIPNFFMWMDSLPLTVHGKVNKKALPIPSLGMRKPLIAPPKTLIELKLVEIWGSVLGLENVGVDEDFFLLGGHSLLVVQMLAKVREYFHVSLPLCSLTGAPTIAKLAALIAESLNKETIGKTHKLSEYSDQT
jgi:amino acid adenylation domain-containing protein